MLKLSSLFLLAVALLAFIWFCLSNKSKKKYVNTAYLSRLQELVELLNLIKSLKGYITWIERNQLKLTYTETGNFFKNKSDYYKKEERISEFN